MFARQNLPQEEANLGAATAAAAAALQCCYLLRYINHTILWIACALLYCLVSGCSPLHQVTTQCAQGVLL